MLSSCSLFTIRTFINRLMLALCISILSVDYTFASDSDTNSILSAAKIEAQRDGKRIFVLFSGTEWCAPCMILKKNVIDTENFSKYVKKNFVFVGIEQNRAGEYNAELNGKKILAEKGAIINLGKCLQHSGVPTFFVLNSDAKICLRYVGCDINIDEFIEKCESAVSPMNVRDNFFSIPQDEAKASNKNILVYISPTKTDIITERFEHDIINKKSFKGYVKDVVFVNLILHNNRLESIFINTRPEEISLSDYIKLDKIKDDFLEREYRAYPTLLLFNSEGRILEKITGCGLDADDVVKCFTRSL